MRLAVMLMDAISKSMGPIGVPFFSKEALILAYVLLLALSKGMISKVETKLSTIARFFFLTLLFSTPKNNSATVIEESLMSDGEYFLNWAMRFSEI
jgi:hypothetical protein